MLLNIHYGLMHIYFSITVQDQHCIAKNQDGTESHSCLTII